jgi:glycosyltransferase involved in cell wall biosynthesis
MKFLLFGTGDYYERYKKWFNKDDIVALLDNSPSKQNTLIDGIRVFAPDDGIKSEYDCIVILSFYVKTMRRQLEKLGVEGNKIFHFYDLHSLLSPIIPRDNARYYNNAKSIVDTDCKSKVLILSQELTLSGASLAIFKAALILKRNNYKIVYASMIDGPLKERILENDIPLIIDNNLQVTTMKELKWVQSFSLIFCSTINFHIFLSDRNCNVPIIWWLHDAPFFYDGIRMENMEKISNENLKVVSVGAIPRNAFNKFRPDLAVGDFLYGVEDCNHIDNVVRNEDKVCFVLIGTFENIKGQDVLLNAVDKIPELMKKDMEVILVGNDNTLFASQLKEEHKKLKEVHFTGSVDRQEIHKILERADVLVCPSREDSMPTVVAEAMMHGVPCIVSNATGTAGYIHDGLDSFIFKSEDVDELAAKMSWCMEHREQLTQMGRKSRKIYEKYFSMEVFEENLLDIVEGI